MNGIRHFERMPQPTEQDILERQAALGRRVRELRKQKGWSQDTFAHIVGMGRSYPYRIEKGELDMRFSMLLRIAAAMEIPVTELLEEL